MVETRTCVLPLPNRSERCPLCHEPRASSQPGPSQEKGEYQEDSTKTPEAYAPGTLSVMGPFFVWASIPSPSQRWPNSPMSIGPFSTSTDSLPDPPETLTGPLLLPRSIAPEQSFTDVGPLWLRTRISPETPRRSIGPFSADRSSDAPAGALTSR